MREAGSILAAMPVKHQTTSVTMHPSRFGRFEVRRLLGRGGQSAVYLAHDPELRRDVAIKLLHAPASDADAVRREARTVGQLSHPNIVPIHELGEHQGRVYLVFGYIDGRTLAQALAQDGPLEPRRAVELMIAILEALAAAHEQGVIHRDLKPSNILLDAAGWPHVMDFGIATRPEGAAGLEPDLVGSPAYMAPEYIRNRLVSESYDLFSAGLVMYEILFGRRAFQGDNPFQVLHQIASMPLVYPVDAGERIGPVLHDILAKATAKEPELRYATARQMQQALKAYLQPSLDPGSAANGQQSTLEFLLRRMKVKGDFPAMSAAMSAIQRLAASDRADVGSLSNSILKDFALTNKILRMVNSAYYANRSGERIRTVTRAIVMLGFDAVRSIAVSLMLFDRLRDKKHADVLREEFLRTSLSGSIARELCMKVNPAQSEEAFICAMFHNLGRLLSYYYFWDEAEMIRRLMVVDGCSEQVAAVRVLGISYAELGIGVTQSWGFPGSIVQSMRGLEEGRVPRATTADAQLHQVSVLANEMYTALQQSEPAQREAALARLAARYGNSLALSGRDFDQAIQRSATALQELSATLGISLRRTSLGSQLDPPQRTLPPAGGAAVLPVAVQAVTQPGEADSSDSDTPESILSAGIQDISKALVEEMPVNDLLRIVAETTYRALDVRRVLVCMRDSPGGLMQAKFGFGEEMDQVLSRFSFAVGGSDLFNAILTQDAGVLIRDSREAKVRSRLPGWYLQNLDAPTFIVFPLVIRKVPVAMIYADQDRAGAIQVSGQQLSLLHTLRNQALVGIRQAR